MLAQGPFQKEMTSIKIVHNSGLDGKNAAKSRRRWRERRGDEFEGWLVFLEPRLDLESAKRFLRTPELRIEYSGAIYQA